MKNIINSLLSGIDRFVGFSEWFDAITTFFYQHDMHDQAADACCCEACCC